MKKGLEQRRAKKEISPDGSDNKKNYLGSALKRVWAWIMKRFWRFFLPDRFDRARIEPEVVLDICEMAAGSWPQEMIAFLRGSVKKESLNGKNERVLVIDGLYVKSYFADHDSTHFSMHDLPPLGVYGTVHSHPGKSNRPSLADKRLFSSYGVFHLIICQPYTKEAIATYNRRGEIITGVELG